MSIEELRTKIAERESEKGKVEAEVLTKTTAAESEINSTFDPKISELKGQLSIAQEEVENTQKLLDEVRTKLGNAKENAKKISNDIKMNEKEKATVLKNKHREIQADRKSKLKYLNIKVKELYTQIKEIEKEQAVK
ncbi:unnamed protein product [marine sediment metagenome]|uniref:Uncharacterized protein n=1 Tax=marine sediment metagenome TaxID=412755 RepID=X1AM89_9ZZZZ